MGVSKKILLASPRGYCAGVDRAINTVEKALEQFGTPIYVRKEIVHNKHVVAQLTRKGVIFVDEVTEVPIGQIVIFSAHGISPKVRQIAESRNLHCIDATCPLVTKVHQESRRFARDDYDILLIGHKGHEEVEGTAGQAPDKVQIVDEMMDLDTIQIKDENKVVWLSQTTLSMDETLTTVKKLREKFPNLKNPPSDDICYATQNRQIAVKAMAPKCDLVLVVGSQNSSNSKRLAEVALHAGAKASYLIDDAAEILPQWIENVNTIGVTSGASVPEILVQEVLDSLLTNYGFSDIECVSTVEEQITFSLPRELRSSRKSKN